MNINLKSVKFDQKDGTGSIVLKGKLKVQEGVVDDPVIEIFNAVQQKMQDAIFKDKGVKLINFTPLFPIYDEGKNITVYKLVPSKPAGAPIKSFLSEAEVTLDVFYKNLFIASFKQFLEDRNEVCNYNGYSLYNACMERIGKEKDPDKKQYDIQTIKMLLENFINFLGLPLPRSKQEHEKKAALLTLQWMNSGELHENLPNVHNFKKDPRELIDEL